jgi:hypothetical protein
VKPSVTMARYFLFGSGDFETRRTRSLDICIRLRKIFGEL